MSRRTYSNPWIPSAAAELLRRETGTILDVGGGAAPFIGATHILDAQPFDPVRLENNRWGQTDRSGGVVRWTAANYTQADLCAAECWPFADKAFDLALCSHTLEDLRDPLPVVRELCRVSRRVLVICPSRLLEQTRGIEHPSYSGFYHHPWMVSAENGELVFRRKTAAVELRGCHLTCPLGRTLRVEWGAMWVCAETLRAREYMEWDLGRECQELQRFVAPYRERRDLFTWDSDARRIKFWIWRLRQMALRVP